MSVDALRGFDMLWIIGAGGVVKALEGMTGGPVSSFLVTQLTHVKWIGFHFYDLIFPLFLYIVGVSLVFSLDKALARGGRARVLARVFRRSLLLFAIGMFYYGGISKGWHELSFGGVLQRIAACYFLAALIYLYVNTTRGLIAVCATLLIGYWAAVTFIPFPDLKLEKEIVENLARQIGSESHFAIAASVSQRTMGVYEEGRNLVNFVDFLFLPGRKPQHYYINEGLLSTFPSVVLTLLGVITGLLFKNETIQPQRKIAWMLVGAMICIGLGLGWSLQFPLIKRIWSSSFVLLSGGLSLLCMTAFYTIVDVLRWRRWCQPFVWVGTNALTIYVIARIVDFQELASYFAGGEVREFLNAKIAQGLGNLVIALIALVLAMLLTRFLYKQELFIRV